MLGPLAQSTSTQSISDELKASVAWQPLSDALGGLREPLSFRNFLRGSTSFGASATTSVINGTLDSTDPRNPTRTGTLRDDYLLTGLTVGQTVQLNLSSTAFDSYLQVVNAATGQIIAYNDDANFTTFNSQLTFTVAANVDYIVRATTYNTTGTTGAYSLSSDLGILTAATPIGSNQNISGRLVNTDPINSLLPGSLYDGYLLTNLVAGQQVQVNLNSSAFDSYLQVVNAATGEIVAYNDNANGGLNSQVTFTVQDAVDYIVRATGATSGATGAYTLTTTTTSTPPTFNTSYGYGLVDASAAVATALGQSNPFADVTNLGGNSWGLDAVRAPEVWAQGYTGQGIVVAVIDTGVDYTHLDLDANIWVNSGEIAGNGLDDDNNGYADDIRGWDFIANDNNPMDENGHGTHVSGIIAAENNDFGMTGVAYNARIMPVRVLNAAGSGTTLNIAAGIRYAANNGADVINISLGAPYPAYSSEIAAAVEYATQRGAVVVMASGNEYDSRPGFPAYSAQQSGIAVGAVDSTNKIANFSNVAGNTPLDYLVAPGVGIYSTTPNNTYASYNGTSMATPYVSGVAALVLSANSNLTPAQVENILTTTANRTSVTV